MSRRVLAFAALLAWCALLLFVRIERTGSLAYAFLVWNLFLAAIPAFAAAMLSRARGWAGWLWGALWLVFLPNAPYIATDLMHLRPRPPAPLWYDVALLLSCAATGILLAYVSLADVQRVIEKRLGALASWAFAAAALVLSGFGIYLGRFLRWNSWQILTDPWPLLGDIAARVLNPMAHPRTMAVTMIYGFGLFVGYAAFCGLATARSLDSSPPPQRA